MKIGKIPNEILETIVISNIDCKRKEVLVGSGIGEDNSILDLGGDLCVLSTDPITGTSKGLGKLAVNISINDVASSGGDPVGVLLTILLPVDATLADLEEIMLDAGNAARDLNVEIIGGHTEVTDSVNRPVITSTVVGRLKKQNMPDKAKIEVGHKIIVSKKMGIEGTAIILGEKLEELKGFLSPEDLSRKNEFERQISVLREGKLCGNLGANYLHDITEGGVLGAVWEAAKAIGRNIKVDTSLIPIDDLTIRICKYYKIDPLKLISSGSMLMVASEDDYLEMKKALRDSDTDITIIGQVVEGREGIVLDENDNLIASPATDDLYKVVSFS